LRRRWLLAVIKPAFETPFSCLAFAKLAIDADIPEIGMLLASWRRIPLLITSSTAVSKALIMASAQTMKKVSMELGDNAPLIVFQDGADLEKAVDGLLICKYRCTGQTCVWYDLFCE
jgi:succinate-semialdehyde dehydrogenase / glutarate-semialdehyde dehydrogenase